MTDKIKSTYYTKVMDRGYQPNKADMSKDVSVPVTSERLAKAALKGGAPDASQKIRLILTQMGIIVYNSPDFPSPEQTWLDRRFFWKFGRS